MFRFNRVLLMIFWCIVLSPILCCLYMIDWCCHVRDKKGEQGMDEFSEDEQSKFEDDLIEKIKDDKADKYRIDSSIEDSGEQDS